MADTKGAVDAKLAEDKRKADLAARLKGAASIPAVGSGGPSNAAVMADFRKANYRVDYSEALEMAYMQLAYRIQAEGDLSKVSQVIDPKNLAEEIAKLKKMIVVSDFPTPNTKSLQIPSFLFNPQDKGLIIYALVELLKANEPIDSLTVPCQLTDDEIIALTQALHLNTTVKTLRFSAHHNLGDVGCFLLVRALQGNRSITTVDINCLAQFTRAHNDTIGDLSAMAFANVLSADAKTSLERLCLEGCSVSEYGVAQLLSAVPQSKIKQLVLSHNNFDPNAREVQDLVRYFQQSKRSLIIDLCSRKSSPYSLTEDTAYEFVGRSFIGTPVSQLTQMNGAEARTGSDAGAAAAPDAGAAAAAAPSGAAVALIIHAMHMHVNRVDVAGPPGGPITRTMEMHADTTRAAAPPAPAVAQALAPVATPAVSAAADAPRPKGPKG
jgi:hypothetical protein